MYYIEDLLKIFGVISTSNISENFDFYEIEATLKHCNKNISKDSLTHFFDLTTHRNLDVTIIIKFDGQEPVRFSSNNVVGIDTELSEYADRLELNQSPPTLEIRIDKSSEYCHIFDLQRFVEFHQQLDIEKCFSCWAKYDFSKKVEVLVWGSFEGFETNSIVFYQEFPTRKNAQAAIEAVSTELRAKCISNRDKCSHFVNAKQIQLIPDDFRIHSSKLDNDLKREIGRLFNCLVIAFLADFSSIDENRIKYRLKGYKLISETVSTDKLANGILNDLDEIYQWVYGDGDFSDKIGLSRNIISIHLLTESLLSIESGTADSVRSGYDLYLKENVKQYIEIKNKISEFILTQSDRATEIPKGMFGMFKTNLWTFTTFFITVFLLRILKDGRAEGAFTFEILIVSILLVAFSFVFLVISTIEVNSDKRRLLSRYIQIKERYKDLIDKKDLKKLLDVDSLKVREGGYISRKRNLYVLVWFLTNLILLLTVLFMYCKF